MGKKQHQKDKLYITNTEWKYEWGGYKGTAANQTKFRRLPFDCCCLSLQPFENPLCTKEGVIFDLMNIVPFLKKYGVNPATGDKMSGKDLIRLHFHKNSDEKYHCPVTFKVFNENTHITAIAVTGNVYAYDAVSRLNIKTGHLKDLLTDESFTRKDIITIQDPSNLDKFNMSEFYYLKNNLKLVDEEEEEAKKDPKYFLKSINSETRDILDTLDKEYKAPAKTEDQTQPKADKFNAAHYSTGAVAASFTSTAITPQTEHESAVINEDIIRYERIKKKGYVKLLTNLGQLNIELHCNMVPKICENFLKHCANGYYDGTVFHRSIRHFMIQGGDPTGTGKGGESIWGGTFDDHFKPNLTHTGRGVLSMANSGSNTNKSQFFFTFRSCKHLDRKHSVFGKIVGGLDTLDKMEAIETNKHDKPKIEIRLEKCTVFVDPYEEADELLQKERQDEIEKQTQLAEAESKSLVKPMKVAAPETAFASGVGRYINPSSIKRNAEEGTEGTRKKVKASSGFGNFSSW